MPFYNNVPIVLRFPHRTPHNQYLIKEENLVLLQIFFLVRTLPILLVYPFYLFLLFGFLLLPKILLIVLKPIPDSSENSSFGIF
jgi:hypothetical protein